MTDGGHDPNEAPLPRPSPAVARDRLPDDEAADSAAVESHSENARVDAKAAGRNPRIALLVGAVVTVAAVVAAFLWRDAERSRAQIAAATAEVDARNARLERADHAARIARAREALDQGESHAARSELAAIEPQHRAIEWEWLTLRATPPTPATPQPFDAPIADVAFSPDGARLAVASTTGDVAILDWPARERTAHIRGAGQRVAWFGDSVRIATASADGPVSVYDATTLARLSVGEHEGGALAVAVSADGSRIATAGFDGRLRLTRTGSHAATYVDPRAGLCRTVALDGSGGRLLVAGSAAGARLVDVVHAEVLRSFAAEGMDEIAGANAAVFDPAARSALVAFRSGRVLLFDVETGAVRHELEMHRRPRDQLRGAWGAHFGAGGRWAVTCGFDNALRIRAAEAGRLVGVLDGSQFAELDEPPPRGARFSPDGRWLVAWSGTPRLLVWTASDVALPVDVAVFDDDVDHDEDAPAAVAVTADGRAAYAFAGDGRLARIDLSTGAAEWTVQLPTGVGERAVVDLPQHASVAAIGPDLVLHVLDVRSGARVRTIEPPKEVADLAKRARCGPLAVAVSPDGWRVAAAVGTRSIDRDLSVRAPIVVYDLDARAGDVRVLPGHTATTGGIAFSADGGRLASGGYDGRFRLWDLHAAGDAPIADEPLDGPFPLAITLTPGGNTFLVGLGDGRVRAHDARTGLPAWSEPIVAMSEPIADLRAIDGGRRLLVLGVAGRLGIFDADRREVLGTVLPCDGRQRGVLSQDGGRVLLPAARGAVRSLALRPPAAAPTPVFGFIQGAPWPVPLSPEDEKALRAMVETYFRDLASLDDVLAAIARHGDLSEQRRAAAVARAKQIGEQPAALLARVSPAIRHPQATPESLERALRLSTIALSHSDPATQVHGHAAFWSGAALLRLGRTPEAEFLLRRADGLLNAPDSHLATRSPAPRALLAAAAHRLDRRDEARQLLADARAIVDEQTDEAPDDVAAWAIALAAAEMSDGH